MRQRISRASYRHVEAELYAYPETLREIQRTRRDIIERGMAQALDAQVTRVQSSAQWSNPTLARASALFSSERLRELCRIADAIGGVYRMLPDGHRDLIRLRYWKRPGEAWAYYASEIGADESTLRRWRNEVVELIAARLGWG